jgi:hypothetical protein
MQQGMNPSMTRDFAGAGMALSLADFFAPYNKLAKLLSD